MLMSLDTIEDYTFSYLISFPLEEIQEEKMRLIWGVIETLDNSLAGCLNPKMIEGLDFCNS